MDCANKIQLSEDVNTMYMFGTNRPARHFAQSKPVALSVPTKIFSTKSEKL